MEKASTAKMQLKKMCFFPVILPVTILTNVQADNHSIRIWFVGNLQLTKLTPWNQDLLHKGQLDL